MRARLRPDEPELPREAAARARLEAPRCNRRWGGLVPGLAQLCAGEDAEGGALLGLGIAELGAGIFAATQRGLGSPAAALPLLSFGDLLAYSAFAGASDDLLARHLEFVPQDTLGELVAAPWTPRVLAAPDVWAGILGTLAAGVGLSLLTDGVPDPRRLGTRPVIFGSDLRSAFGYPAAFAIGAGLFTHVAVAEETIFRGAVQSSFARRTGSETDGWLLGSLVFGLAHAPNALFLSTGSDRLTYLGVGVPFITALGSYLGLVYRWHGYTLAPSVAIHFWYDLLLSAYSFAFDPKHSPISGSIAFPF